MGYLQSIKEDNPEKYAEKFGDAEPDSYAICKICGKPLGEHFYLTCPKDKKEQ